MKFFKKARQPLSIILSIVLLFSCFPPVNQVTAAGERSQELSANIVPTPSPTPESPDELFSDSLVPMPSATPPPSGEFKLLNSGQPVADEEVTVSNEVYADTNEQTLQTLRAKTLQKKNLLQARTNKQNTNPNLSRITPQDAADLSREEIQALVESGASMVDVYWINFLLMGQTKLTSLDILKLKQDKQLSWEDVQAMMQMEPKDNSFDSSVVKNVYDEIASDLSLDARSSVISDVYETPDKTLQNAFAPTSFTAFDASVSSILDDMIVQAQINQVQKPQYNDRDKSGEVVDPVSGSLNYKKNLLHLPGVDGLDLDVGIMYNSNQTVPFTHNYYWNPNFGMYDHDYNYGVPFIGNGWSFQFPYIQNSGDDYTAYYHDGQGNTYKLGNIDELSNYTGLINYKGKDKRFVSEPWNNGQFSNGQNRSSGYIEHSDLTREYYSTSGQLIGIVDRFGNAITFNYTYGYISSITDTLGRVVRISYEDTLNSSNFDGDDIVLSVYDGPSEVQKVVLTKGRVIASMPNGALVEPYKRAIPVLYSFTDQNGEKTYFDYQNVVDLYNTYGYNLSSLLKEIRYPHSTTKYEMEGVSRKIQQYDYVTEYRVKSRGDYTGSKAYYQMNYSYDGDYTGNGVNEYPNHLPDNFRFSTTSRIVSNTPSNGIQTTNTFDKDGRVLRTETREAGGERKVIENTAFHGLFTQSPIRTTISEYSAQDSDATADRKYTETELNEWGLVRSQTQPLTSDKFNNPGIKQHYTTTYQYEPKYRFLDTTSWYQNESDLAPKSERYTYTDKGRPATATNALGEQTTYSYDSRNTSGGISQVTTEKIANGQIVARNITLYGPESRYANPTEQQQYFNIGKPDQKIVKTYMTYDLGTGNLKSQKDGNNQIVEYEYDAAGRPKKETYPIRTNSNGQTFREVIDYNYYNQSSVNFDSVNDGTFVLKVNTIKTLTYLATNSSMSSNSAVYYNGLGLGLMEEHWNSNVGKWVFAHYHYDDQGRATYQKDTEGNEITATYDVWGKQNRATSANGDLVVSDYNTKMRLSTKYISDKLTGEALNYSEQQFDEWGNLISTSTFKDWPANQQRISESYRYDIRGNVTGYTDPNRNLNEDGVTTSYTYDALDRLIAVKDALNQTTKYAYDGNSQLSAVTIQAKNGSPQMLNAKTYNELGLLNVKQDGASQSESYAYNSLGQLEAKTDRNGSAFGYTYDEGGQLKNSFISGKINNVAQTEETKIIQSAGNSQTKKIQALKNGAIAATLTQTFDNLGQVRSAYVQSGTHSAYIANKLDTLGRMTELNDSYMSFYTKYQYNKVRLEKVQTNGSSTLSNDPSVNAQYSYYANNLVDTIVYPTLTDGSRLISKYTYNKALGWTETLTNTKGNSVLSSYSYGYDNNGNRTSVSESRNGTAAQTTYYGYDVLNRLESITRPDGSQTKYTYDVRGNRQTLSDTSSIGFETMDTSYTYDLQNTLTSMTKGGSVTSFKYYADGLRFTKTNGSTQTQVDYNFQGQVITEGKLVNGVLVEQANFVRGDRVLVKKDKKTVQDYYYLYNGHGDVVQIVNTSGVVVNNYNYDEWGNITGQVEGVSNSFKYTGEVHDAETGLYYLRARYYDPSIGRFLNEDTVEGQIDNPLTQNLYTYVINNPLIYIDPTGHMHAEGAGWGGFAGNRYSATDPWKGWSGPVGSVANFLILDDVNTLRDPDSSALAKGLAAAGFIPLGKVVKGGKLTLQLLSKEGKVVEKEFKLAGDALKAAQKACNCFTAGTKVQTDEGEKPIEDIEVGDKVLSKSDETGEVAYKEVVGLFQKQADEIYYVHVGDEIIEVTGEHPFWLDGKGWTFVKDLKVGDLLVSSDGSKLVIDKIEKEPRKATVYNFEVKDFNSYFVSNLGVWVHNCALQNVFKSIKEAPLYPKGFSGAKNGTVKNKVNNGELLEELRAIESGTWNKIYKDGVDANGKKISIHYFQSQSGQVFNVKVKNGWSNSSSQMP
ncbi:polymorphic toxin-type HINT domain-containing protein [Paenibacillus silagei]|uniref:RHS repeat-associated protein n=1 Tax=Paenibacillus silagei TaxID=1670801 RepID=A0ABS4P0V8_9BACL|nr:polymorphic toxin-type HINT domain-containing protein [Paenibacillus silagei]MBP2115936.1 RHS repeat-associated protein [Paenibacillus silagei]